MKILVIGGTGTIGREVVAALGGAHEVIVASRRGDPRVDLADARSIEALFTRVRDVDAVVCCAANAPLGAISRAPAEDFIHNITPKLLGQVRVALYAAAHLRDGGSITLTSGGIPAGTPGSAGGALVNAGLEAFVRAAADDLHRGLRINAVRPGWIRETMLELGMEAYSGTPAAEAAYAYLEAIEGEMSGEILCPGPSSGAPVQETAIDTRKEASS